MTTKLQDNIRALLDLSAPAPGIEPPRPERTPRPVYHSDECSCESCCDIRASMDLYLEAKANLNLNNWWNS